MQIKGMCRLANLGGATRPHQTPIQIGRAAPTSTSPPSTRNVSAEGGNCARALSLWTRDPDGLVAADDQAVGPRNVLLLSTSTDTNARRCRTQLRGRSGTLVRHCPHRAGIPSCSDTSDGTSDRRHDLCE